MRKYQNEGKKVKTLKLKKIGYKLQTELEKIMEKVTEMIESTPYSAVLGKIHLLTHSALLAISWAGLLPFSF